MSHNLNLTSSTSSSSGSSDTSSSRHIYSSGNNVYEGCGLVSRLPVQIECITAYDDYVIVGSKDGHLLIYKVTFRSQPKLHPDIEIVLSNKNFTSGIGSTTSKKPVIQLDVIPEHKVLIALTSEGISTHDLSMYYCKYISTMERTRGASLFTLNVQRTTTLTGELSIVVRICVVVNRALQFYYWKNKSFHFLREDIVLPDTPRAISWCDEIVVFGFKSEYCLVNLVTSDQKDVCSRAKVGEPIITVVSSSEYAVANDKQFLMFQFNKGGGDRSGHPHHHNILPGAKNVPSTFSSFPLVPEEDEGKEKNAVITWTEHPVGLVYDAPYFVGILSGGIEVRTVRPKLKIDLYPIPQAKFICSPKSGLIFVASNDSLWALKSKSVLHQMDLFVKQNHFELALGLANIWKEVDSEKQKKIAQIKNLFAFHLFCKKKFKEAMTLFMELGTDASHVIGLFPGLLPPEFCHQIDYPGPVPELRGSDFEEGIQNLIIFLTNSRTVLLGNATQSVTESASIVEGASTIKSKKQLLQIIDTTLLKCYLQTKESLVPSLLRLKDNHCHVQEAERALIKHKKFNELIILYQTKGNHRKALETLHQQNDFDGMVEYLQNLGREEIELIFEFAKPVLEHDSLKGLQIFMEDVQEVDQLSRPKVYDFLSKTFPSLKIAYLEHLIHVWGEKSGFFHNALVNEYREHYLVETDDLEKKDTLKKLRDFVSTSSYYSPEIVLVQFPHECMFEERAIILERIGKHDQVMAIYVTVLKEPEKAMKYCKKIYEKGGPGKKDVFSLLVKLLLYGPRPTSLPGFNMDFSQHDADVKSVMQLLKEYAPYLDPMQILASLPDYVELADIERFLMTSVQSKLAEKRKMLIQKGLQKAEYLRATKAQGEAESERFYLDESTPCDICRKRVASHTAFVRNPDKTIVHFHCQPDHMDQYSSSEI